MSLLPSHCNYIPPSRAPQPPTYFTYDELCALSKPSMDNLYHLVKREIEEKEPKLLMVERLTHIYGLSFSNRFFARHEAETEANLKKLLPAPDSEDDETPRPPKKRAKRESRSRARPVEPEPESPPEPPKKKKSKKRSASPQPDSPNKKVRAKSKPRAKSKARAPTPDALEDVSSYSRLASHTMRPLSRRE